MLTFELNLPDDPREGSPLVVLLHGRGTDRYDLLPLSAHLPAGSILVTPQGPHPGEPWGYGPGWAWYRHVSENRVEPEGLHVSLDALETFLAELPTQLPVSPGPLVLGGFSQGGTVSTAYALTRPGTVPMVMNLSGFVVDDPLVPVTREGVVGSRFFWGHGTGDMAVGHHLAVSGRARLRSVDADLVERDYAMGHQISEGELADVTAWMSGVAKPTE